MESFLLAMAFTTAPIDKTTFNNPFIETETAIVQPTTIEHTTIDGDTLDKIATEYETTALRLFYKNAFIEHPDEIEIGVVLVVPGADEVLEPRELPLPPEPVYVQISRESSPQPTKSVSYGASPAHSWWGRGQCTSWVASRRSVGKWNNASEWIWQAQRDGWSTGSTPVAGSIAQKGNHVAYVESVNADGTFNLSEMNYRNVGEVTYRTVSTSGWRFIY